MPSPLKDSKLDIPALASIHKHEKKDGFVPGSRVPIRVKEAALFTYGMRPFLVYKTDQDKYLLCCPDRRFNMSFIGGDTVTDALKLWYDNFNESGDGL